MFTFTNLSDFYLNVPQSHRCYQGTVGNWVDKQRQIQHLQKKSTISIAVPPDREQKNKNELTNQQIDLGIHLQLEIGNKKQ